MTATTARPEANTSSASLQRYLFPLTIFLSAFLLFQVQLIIGKYILPWFGGMPAVWNTCMLVFQVLLLVGYGYAHVVSTKLSERTARGVHVGVLLTSLAAVLAGALMWGAPLTPGEAWKPAASGNPVWQIMLLLMVAVGAPFAVLSTTGSLVQKWYSQVHGSSAYRLYAVSNLGSLLALLTYPILVEPLMTVKHQAWFWSALFILFVAACASVARLPHTAASATEAAPETSDNQNKNGVFFWIALPACASVLLLATTNMLCQEVAVIPFLWVLPLALYLLTFVAAFDSPRWYKRSVWQTIFFLFGMLSVALLLAGSDPPITSCLVIYSVMMFSACMILHGETARLKPAPSKLTLFYLCISIGGAIGGVLIVLVAPLAFRSYYEFPIAIVAAALLMIAALWRDDTSWLRNGRSWVGAGILLMMLVIMNFGAYKWYAHQVLGGQRGYAIVVLALALFFLGLVLARSDKRSYLPLAASLLIVLVCSVLLWHTAQSDNDESQAKMRNFFGVKTLIDKNGLRYLRHGHIMHGWEVMNDQGLLIPTGYYSRQTGVSDLFEKNPRKSGLRVGIIGLGAGTLAAYSKAGDLYRFYEIDPQVIALSTAKRPAFRFLQRAPGDLELVPGDARLSLERELARGERQNFDVLLVDAFSGDSIPVHLLTEEAVKLYRQHLRDEHSVIAFHISNRSLDLRPVIAGFCDKMGMAAVFLDTPAGDWVMVAKDLQTLNAMGFAELASPDGMGSKRVHWTDTYSNLFQILRANGSRGSVAIAR